MTRSRAIHSGRSGVCQRVFTLHGGNLAAFEDTTSRELLLAGPAGTGKTFANLAKIHLFCSLYPGARCLIVRKTRRSLTETALVTWEREVLGPGHPVLARPIDRGHRHAYVFPNGSRVVAGGMDNPDKVLSSDWDLIYVNEATELEKDEWETLGSRLRTMAGPYDQIFGDCNPTTPHHWLYKRTLSSTPLCKRYDTYHWENPRYYDVEKGTWTEAGRRYVIERLGQLTGTRRDRFLKGLWVAASGLVYDYDPLRHRLPPDWRPPDGWVRVWSIDWGKTSPTVLQFWAVDDEGRMYLYREFYRTRFRPDRLANWVRGEVEAGREPLPRAIVCDHDEERKEEFERVAGPDLLLRLADKKDRHKGIEACQSRFDNADDGRPRIFFKENTLAHDPDPVLVESGRPTNTIDELTSYCWDENTIRDEPVAENDHGMDAMRYAERYISSHLAPSPAVPYTSNRSQLYQEDFWS